MILQPLEGRWKHHSGAVVRYKCPQTAREVLPLYSALIMQGGALKATPQLVEHCQRWLRPYLLNARDPETLLRYQLAHYDVILLAVEVLEEVSLEREVLDEMADYVEVIVKGGCECRICEGRKKKRDATPTDLRLCKYEPFSDEVKTIAGLYTPYRDSDTTTAPWWVYQVRQAVNVAEARVQRQRRKEQRIRQKIQELKGTR